MPTHSDRTRLIASATRRGQGRRPVNPPLERASTMLSDAAGVMRDETDGPTYGLSGTSAAHQLRLALADLEGADGVLRRHVAEALIYRRAGPAAQADFDRRQAQIAQSPRTTAF